MIYLKVDDITNFRATLVVGIYSRGISSSEIISEIIVLPSFRLNIDPSKLAIILFPVLPMSEGGLPWKSS